MDNQLECRICGETQNVAKAGWQNGFGDFYNCPKCGKYIVETFAEKEFESKKTRSAAYYYLRNIYLRRDKPFMITNQTGETSDYHMITSEDLMKYYPSNINERLDMILENLYEVNDKFASYIALEANYILNSALFFLESEDKTSIEDVENTIKMLNNLQLLKSHEKVVTEFMIDIKGWERLEKNNVQKKKTKKVFVAMAFSPDMSDVREMIKEVISDLGYVPTLVDEKEHNNQIVPEILYEIRQADFVIADISKNRGGVYYEAGYALGIGKEVILTYNENAEEGVHFDVSQKSQVRYNNLEELKNRLRKRIIATIF